MAFVCWEKGGGGAHQTCGASHQAHDRREEEWQHVSCGWWQNNRTPRAKRQKENILLWHLLATTCLVLFVCLFVCLFGSWPGFVQQLITIFLLLLGRHNFTAAICQTPKFLEQLAIPIIPGLKLITLIYIYIYINNNKKKHNNPSNILFKKIYLIKMDR